MSSRKRPTMPIDTCIHALKQTHYGIHYKTREQAAEWLEWLLAREKELERKLKYTVEALDRADKKLMEKEG